MTHTMAWVNPVGSMPTKENPGPWAYNVPHSHLGNTLERTGFWNQGADHWFPGGWSGRGWWGQGRSEHP